MDRSPQPMLIFYDGWCSVCTTTATYLSNLDHSNQIECIDLRSDDPRINASGIPIDELIKSMHTIDNAGTIRKGPDAIRSVLKVLGKARRASWTGWPIIRPIVDFAYRWFAKGPISAHGQLTLTANAQVQGDLTAGTLVVAQGASFVGHCNVGPAAQDMINGTQTATTALPTTPPASNQELKNNLTTRVDLTPPWATQNQPQTQSA